MNVLNTKKTKSAVGAHLLVTILIGMTIVQWYQVKVWSDKSKIISTSNVVTVHGNNRTLDDVVIADFDDTSKSNVVDVQNNKSNMDNVVKVQKRNNDDNNNNNSVKDEPAVVVAYTVVLSNCPPYSEENWYLHQGAAVLQHSIRNNSVRRNRSRFDYQMYAIVHPDILTSECSVSVSILEKLGYKILVRDIPVNTTEIVNEFYRKNVVTTGCCGAHEFLKLYAYTLVEHPIVVLLDLDALILQPLDNLFDAILYNNSTNELLHVMNTTEPLPEKIDAFFTKDYNMRYPWQTRSIGVQGGFLVARPSLDTFRNQIRVVQQANFTDGGGWGDLGDGWFYGAFQVQGLWTYYYEEIVKNTSVELNNCVYNNMAINPRLDVQRLVARTDLTADSFGDWDGKCLGRGYENECEDCRELPLKDVKTVHFTVCQKPWKCLRLQDYELYDAYSESCLSFQREWFRVRRDIDESAIYSHAIASDVTARSATDGYIPEQFLGYCTEYGVRGYVGVNFLPV